MQPQELVKAAAGLGQPAVAVTDTFNTFGALEFSEYAAESGVQPIIGAQVLLRDSGEAADGEVALLVQNEQGWRNLSGLVYDAMLEEGDPAAIGLKALEGRSEGLILLTGGARGGFIAAPLAAGQLDLASARLDALMPLFDGRVYIELQRHGTEAEGLAEPGLMQFAYSRDLPLVATNDCYFRDSGSAPSHDVLLCISQGVKVENTARRRETPEHYFKSGEEMARLFNDLPEAIANTAVVARRCAYRVPARKPILPAFPMPDGMTEPEFLRQKASDGLQGRLSSKAFEEIRGDPAKRKVYEDRLEMELDTIIEMGFPGYFLIVADFIGWAKEQGIPVGPGRGSGAGSLVAYALSITDLDPIRWGLLFERFLNPERVSMPDFDIDFCQDRRDEVIAYVQDRYGSDHVAQIITFGSLQARAAVRDVGRVLGLPYSQVDRIAKLIPFNPSKPVKLNEAIETEAGLRRERDEDEQVANMISIAGDLEGLYRHASTHAAGLVIGDRPLSELVPLYRDPRSDMPVTQFSMKWVEMAGLVKFDFLGLKTLTVLQQVLALINRRGVELSLDDIPLSDEKTFEMLSRGDTVGVFQLESSGMRDALRGLKPDRFEDIIAVVALYRPGPMVNIPKYIARKHGREEVEFIHPALQPVLEETYGIMIYQEQVQQSAQRLAGYTLAGADILRRAMSKKNAKEMADQRDTFIKGAGENGIDQTLAGNIFEQIDLFAGYGFNKSHAAAYALIAWQTAWLKAHYPSDFLAASMTLDAGYTDKLSVFRQDCQALGIRILPPDVNESDAVFSVEEIGEGLAIRYALGAVRNVGMEAMQQLSEERRQNGRFTSIGDFASRLAGALTRPFLENLVKAGAFDSIEPNRNKLLSGLDAIMAHGAALHRERESAQSNLFGDAAEGAGLALVLPDVPDMIGKEKLAKELEALGLYVSAHPLDDFAEQLAGLGVTESSSIIDRVKQDGGGSELKLAGIVSSKQIRISKKGNRFAFVQLADQHGTFEVLVFTETLEACQALLDGDLPLLVRATARVEGDNLKLMASGFELLEGAASSKSKAVELRLTDVGALEGVAAGLARDGAGPVQLSLMVTADEEDVQIDLPGRYRLSSGLRQMLKSLPGVATVREKD